MSSYSDGSDSRATRVHRKQPVRRATLRQSSPKHDEYQPDRTSRSRPSLASDFTAHEGPRIVNIEEALEHYHPAVVLRAPFTKAHRKDDTIHEEITVHLAINGKRPKTSDECRTAVVVKAPWGDNSDRWTCEKDGSRYFFILDDKGWRAWEGVKEGLSHKALAFPIEVSLQREICDMFVIILSIPQDFRARRSSSLSSQASRLPSALGEPSGLSVPSDASYVSSSDVDSEASEPQGTKTPFFNQCEPCVDTVSVLRLPIDLLTPV